MGSKNRRHGRRVASDDISVRETKNDITLVRLFSLLVCA